MHIEARLLVVSVFDIGTTKTQKLCFLKSRTGGSFALNSHKVDSYFVFPVVSHVNTPGFLWEKAVHHSAEVSYLWFAAHLVFEKLELCSFFRTQKLALLFSQSKEALSSFCLLFQALQIEDSVRNDKLWLSFLFFLCFPGCDNVASCSTTSQNDFMVIPPSHFRVLVRWQFKRRGFFLEGVYGHDGETSS